MKTLIFVIFIAYSAILSPIFNIYSFLNIEGFINWISEPTYLSGHTVTGTLTNGMALLCIVGPLTVFISTVVVSYSIYSRNQLKAL